MKISSSMIISGQAFWQASRQRDIAISGRKIRIKQVVEWAGVRIGGTLKISQIGNKLILLRCDYRGEQLGGTLHYRHTKFRNTDLELSAPADLFCNATREWLQKAGDNIYLCLVNEGTLELSEQPQEISRVLELWAGQEAGTRHSCAVLVLNV